MSDLKIRVGDKSYDIPDLDFDHWKKVVERVEKRNEENGMLTSEGISDQVEFYFDLLNPYHSEVTKKTLGKMPVFQGGALFMAQLISELMAVPLDSEAPAVDEKASVSESG